jgi:hypothetical protein
MARSRDGNEDQTHEAIIGWLHAVLPHKEIVHVANEGRRSLWEAARLKRLGLRPGASDIFLIIPRRLIVIEVKRPADKLRKKRAGVASDEQIDFGLRVNALGHNFFIAEGIDDCRRAFAKLGIETREAKP